MPHSPKLDTLVADIGSVLDDSKPYGFSTEEAASLGGRVSSAFANAIKGRDFKREAGKVWASDLGRSCLREYWYLHNRPADGEPLVTSTKVKFLYGNFIEEMLLDLVKKAGHTVHGEQERIAFETPAGVTISGRPDGIIDGHWSDVKSAASFSFSKFRMKGVTQETDSFGYRHQLSFYQNFGESEHAIKGRTPFFLMMDKQMGHIAPIYLKDVVSRDRLISNAEILTTAAAGASEPARMPNFDEPDGKSGNMKLGLKCSYCSFKKVCHPDAVGYRYSNKPVWLTKVVREPKVPKLED